VSRTVNKYNVKFVLPLIALALLLSIFYPQLVSAFNYFDGRGYNVGYFTGQGYPGQGSWPKECDTKGNVMPREYMCDAMKTNVAYGNDRLDTVPELMTYLKDANNGGDYRKKVGSAFIVQTMLSRNYIDANNNGGVNIQAKDWVDLEARLNSSSISWNESAYSDVSTYMKPPSLTDVALDAEPQEDAAIVIRSSTTGEIRYILFRSCANPGGGLGLPPLSWSVEGYSTVSIKDKNGKNKSGAVATTDDIVTWSHKIVSKGLDDTGSNIHYNLGISGISAWSTPGFEYGGGNIIAPFAKYATHNLDGSYATYRVLASDTGQLCEWVQYSPINSWGGVDGRGNHACVDVTHTPKPPVVVNDPCRPITFDVPAPKVYDPVSHTSPDGTHYYSENGLQPVVVTINGSTIGKSPYYTSDTIENGLSNYVTTKYTDGERHTVLFTDKSEHVSGYTDIYVNDYTKPKYNDVPVYKDVPILDSNGKTIGHKSVIDHYDKVFNGTYEQKFSYTITNHAKTTRNTTIGPCYDYKLNIGNSGDFGTKIEAGSNVVISPTVSSSPFTVGSAFWNKYHTQTKSKPITKWYETMFVVAPGKNVSLSTTGGGDSSLDSCSYFKNSFKVNSATATSPTVKCTTVTKNIVFDYKSMSTPSINFPVPDEVAGTKYCFAFSLYPSKSDQGNNSDSAGSDAVYNHSTFNPSANCITVVKKPKTQVLGGDLMVGRKFTTGSATSNISSSTSVVASKAYGSWVEYGIFATGSINGIGSASAFSSKSSLNNVSNTCGYSKLSFNNSSSYNSACSSIIGKYNTNRSIPDLVSSFPKATSPSSPILSGNADLGNIMNNSTYKSVVYGSSGTINITSSAEIQKGKWIVINASGSTININGNIKYTNGPFTDVKDIPQVVIIAADIKIAEGVTNIDAWLIAQNTIDTCSGVGTNLSSAVCKDKLTVNGPVMANSLLLRRTAGAGTGSTTGDPAEIFNLRADAYLWSSVRAKATGIVKPVYVTELAPRY